ncbi:MAG: dTDP-4-dehydrorhamnose 3,5-epimerase family protein [Candidatus Eisenbacteria bacterium]|uniref:dTDP-4-dehydrorhamnose 3,5-epimerase family protein n=1 Tax=Eiseniibacteriota bacterium TaxID=2212470 RepID=A0A948RRK1_UNCEI|nr:dTDP-4-dehydrorhamnose 3,5-epimerase family protein [Candidatus Eisenbacteria bacterium]MBU1949266.1 dTDP-4-dehydrorhamnose 3,5-epimerase family protein [Candidatus Eisenbacteria bacterium]MBU2689690.1 dTDP-4-dehydrorhamnose 3,5-epimerase family protein [Candidatus Eisenbacteria bacterium]
MIDGVITKELKVISDARGYLMEIFRRDDPFFKQFGQAYLSVAYPGRVKGWHYHKIQTDHFAVVKGMGKVVLYDRREGSPTHGEVNELFIGDRRPMLVRIPPGVLHGIKGIGTEPVLLLNIPDEVYNYNEPDEYRVSPHSGEVPYDWSDVDG